MKYRTTILLLLLSLAGSGQAIFDKSKISTATDKITAKIEKVNELMGSAVYEGGIRPQQYDNFILLKETATKEELIELIDHPNGVVRCYSFWALSYDHSVDLFPIIIKHVNDNEPVQTRFGCIGGPERVADFFIDIATPEHRDLNSTKLDSARSAELDSFLIYTPNDLNAKSRAINRARSTESLYPRIRELVIKNNDQDALVALAKYQKEQDVELILKKGEEGKPGGSDDYYTYLAIIEFPHPAFMSFLEMNLQKTLGDEYFDNDWRELYKAIAGYKNDKALELLKIPFTRVQYANIRKYHIDFVFEAVRPFKVSLYDDLLWTLWADENRISPDVFRYLSAQNPQKAFELTKKSLLRSDELFGANINFYFDNLSSSDDLTATMLDFVLQRDRQSGLEIIIKNIKDANVHLFPVFADKAAEIQEKSFVEPLFARFEKEWNAHVYLKIAETLLTYRDSKINHRIAETRKKNKNLKKDWGGQALGKLLKENNIK